MSLNELERGGSSVCYIVMSFFHLKIPEFFESWYCVKIKQNHAREIGIMHLDRSAKIMLSKQTWFSQFLKFLNFGTCSSWTGLLASAEFLCTTWHCCKDLALRHFRCGLSGRLTQRRILELCWVAKSYTSEWLFFIHLLVGIFGF